MEHLTVAGHPEPVPASEVAAALLRRRLDEVRESRGQEAAQKLETMIGERLGTLLADGAPSIDVATMRSIVDYVEIPAEEESTSGLGKAISGIREKLAQRGGPA